MNSVISVPSVAKSIGERPTDNGERPLIPYGRQLIEEDDIAAVVQALRSDWLTQGPRIQEFEKAFAGYVGSHYAVAVNSGTAALHLACLAAGLGPGDEVITSPITFVATANCALYVGARPVFVDIDPETFNLDPTRLEEYLEGRSPFTVHSSQLREKSRSPFTVDRSLVENGKTDKNRSPLADNAKSRRTDNDSRSTDRSTVNGQRLTDFIPRAVIPVHFGGLPCKMPEIHSLARKYGLMVIEDACHALGAQYRTGQGKKARWIRVGSCAHSDMAVFSFHPVKHITTGEGGMITTNSEEIYHRLLLFRNHGITRNPEEFTFDSLQLAMKGNSLAYVGERTTVNGQRTMPSWYYEMQALGYNYRITDIQCALGRSQLKRIETFVERRRSIARQYSRIMRELPRFHNQAEPDGYRSSYHLYTVLTDDEAEMSRDEVMAELQGMGVGTQVHYIPVYRQPFYRRLGFGCDNWPNAEKYFRHCLSIPMFPGMSADDVQHVSSALRKVGRRL